MTKASDLTTKSILVRKCSNCGYINVFTNKKCSGCGLLFVGIKT